MLQTPFFARLVRVGLPHRLRGETWEVCSGVLMGRLMEPHLYEQLLHQNRGRSSLAMEEIEKDLMRYAPPLPSPPSPHHPPTPL